jgi:hypothetical protein
MLVLAAVALAVSAAAAAPAGPPRALRVSTEGNSVRASLVHMCLRSGASTNCSAAPVHLHGTLLVRPSAVLSLSFDRRATSVTVGLMRGATTIRAATKAHGSATAFRWTSPKSLGKANELDVVAHFGRSDSRFAARIKRGPPIVQR